MFQEKLQTVIVYWSKLLKVVKARFNLDVRPFHEVISISPAEHTVTVRHDGQEFTESYDKLVLSPGAKPLFLPLKVWQKLRMPTRSAMFPILTRLWQPWTIIQKKLSLSVQALSGLKWLKIWQNVACKLLLLRKHPMSYHHQIKKWQPLSKQNWLKNGVRVITSQSATRFEDQGKVIVLENGQKITSDLTILSVGVKPENGLAKTAGIELGLRGGILVDEHYETSQKISLQLGMPSSSSKRLQAKMLSSLSLLLQIVRDAKWQTSSQDQDVQTRAVSALRSFVPLI